MNWNINKITKLYRYSAIYDIIVTSPFAIPWISIIIMELLVKINSDLNIGGTYQEISPQHFFALNLMGVIVTIWSVLRIKYPYPILGFYDGIGRFGFSAIMIYYLLFEKYPHILVGLLVPEITWGLIQLLAWVKTDPTYKQLKSH